MKRADTQQALEEKLVHSTWHRNMKDIHIFENTVAHRRIIMEFILKFVHF